MMVAIVVAVSLPLMGVRADPNQKDADAAWKTAGQCAREAFKKYPDYTQEGNAKREAARLECLRDHKLPTPTAAGGPQ
jgi:hypothetical protein